MVRGIGASTSVSRAGFYTTLVAFLKEHTETVSASELFDVMDKQLHVGKGATSDKVIKLVYWNAIIDIYK